MKYPRILVFLDAKEMITGSIWKYDTVDKIYYILIIL